MERILASDEELAKTVPPNMAWLGPIAVMITRSALSAMSAKYPTPYDERAFDAAVSRIRAALQGSSSGYILEKFSYAGATRRSAVGLLHWRPPVR